MFEDELKTWHTEEIICPYCLEICSDSWECSDYDDAMECPHGCGEKFEMIRNITITYTTKKLDGKNETI